MVSPRLTTPLDRLTTPLDNLTTPNGLTASMIILILFNPIISAVRSVRQVRWKQLTRCLLTDRHRLSSVMKSQGGAMQPEKNIIPGMVVHSPMLIEQSVSNIFNQHNKLKLTVSKYFNIKYPVNYIKNPVCRLTFS